MTTQIETKPADIILQQLGGSRKLALLIGAKDFFSDDNGLTLMFKFKGSRKANYIRITLTPADVYDVKFQKIGRLNKKTYETPVTDVAEFEGIYADQLMDIFEATTELYLTLHARQ